MKYNQVKIKMKVFNCMSHISSCSKSVCGQLLQVQGAGLRHFHPGGSSLMPTELSCAICRISNCSWEAGGCWCGVRWRGREVISVLPVLIANWPSPTCGNAIYLHRPGVRLGHRCVRCGRLCVWCSVRCSYWCVLASPTHTLHCCGFMSFFVSSKLSTITRLSVSVPC